MRFNKQPPPEVYASAVKFKFKYYKIITLEDMKNTIRDGMPFVFNVILFSNLISAGRPAIYLPTRFEKPLCRHAMICTGFNDETKMFTVQNSMGEDWGNSGFTQMPYAYLAEPKLCSDMWTIRFID